MNDYLYIKAWGKMLHSFDYYIEMQVARARAEGAPQDAVFYSESLKRWVTKDEIHSEITKTQLEREAEGLK